VWPVLQTAATPLVWKSQITTSPVRQPAAPSPHAPRWSSRARTNKDCQVRLACGVGAQDGTGQERRSVVERRAAGPVLLVPVENVVYLLRQLGALERICMAIMAVSDPAAAGTCME